MKKISNFSFIESFCGFSKEFFKSPLKQGPLTQFQHIMIKIKSTATPCFFVSVECWGYPPQAPDTKDFSGKVLWNLKSFARMEWCSRWEILLLTFLIRKVREGGLERSSNYWRKKKKRGFLRVFLCALNVGAVRLKPGHKKLFGKSFLELQKLCSE